MIMKMNFCQTTFRSLLTGDFLVSVALNDNDFEYVYECEGWFIVTTSLWGLLLLKLLHITSLACISFRDRLFHFLACPIKRFACRNP